MSKIQTKLKPPLDVGKPDLPPTITLSVLSVSF